MSLIIKHNPHGSAQQTPGRVVLHAMGEFILHEGKILPAEDFLLKQGLSAHVLVTPRGEEIKLRKDDEGAYHARGFNKNSLGIEFLVPGIHTYETFLDAIKRNYLTDAAYDTGVNVVCTWCLLHNIQSIDRHSFLDPSRKYDPGAGFPYQKFIDDVEQKRSEP